MFNLALTTQSVYAREAGLGHGIKNPHTTISCRLASRGQAKTLL